MKKQQINNALNSLNKMKKFSLLFAFSFSYALFAQNNENNLKSSLDAKLLKQYVNAKGSGIISFDASNIKQYWIDKTVLSKDNSIIISLNKNKDSFESVPLRIQLANVNETQDCKIEIIADTEKDFSFSVLNDKDRVLSKSANEDDFINYKVVSAIFPLEKTQDLSFQLKISSKRAELISIKKLILSFSRNENYLVSPGILKISNNSLQKKEEQGKDAYSFSLTGKNTTFYPPHKILTTDNTVSTSVKIKNTGITPTRVYIGFILYAKGQYRLFKGNYPFKNTNFIMNVLSSEAQSNRIVVDSCPTNWEPGCYLASNAKEDMSDIPNTQLAGKIVEIKKKDDVHTEILLDKPLDKAIPQGTKLRVHGTSGAYIYLANKVLQPGEEEVFTSKISKDDNSLQHSPKAFSRGVDYVMPLIFSYSVNSDKENTILISDYVISY